MIISPWSGSRGKQSLPTPESHPRQPDSPTRRQKSSCAKKVFIVFFFSAKTNQPAAASGSVRFFRQEKSLRNNKTPGLPPPQPSQLFHLNLLLAPQFALRSDGIENIFYGRCSLKPILSGKRLRQKLFRKNRSDVTGKIPRQLSIKTLWFGPWILFPSLKLGGTSEKYFRFGQLGGSYSFHVPAKGSLFCIGWKLHEIRLYLKHLQHIKVEYMLSLSLCMHCLCSILSWFPISEENCGFFRKLLEAKSLQCFRRPEFEWVGVDTISRVKLAPPSTSQAEQNVLNSFDLMEDN